MKINNVRVLHNSVTT